ncbi:hypothetical protein MA16_Dca006267 [Dendrobium catenatum]|uniref:Transcriptional coactivator Hfi1/Transcriptional adapter 1 n=1 Tax=Dendrobium catenatum TaxID=906689 RepID=A0A2I0W9C9_9ASPA|nr:hypothetical protein MA16_Dca006267 [Dendrobium catenatum]
MSPLPLLPTSRVDLGELKSQLAKRLGAVRARRYFDYLQRLLSQKLSKSEFNKLCFLTLGRENLPLHNQLIRSVLKNACQAKVPPENGETLEHTDDRNKRLSPLQAPLGIPFCQARVDRTRRYLQWAGRANIDRFRSCLDNGELCHTEDLRKRMECVAEIQGMGVAADCAVLLNNGLDTYLKRLIKSSIELAAARVNCETIKQPLHLQEAHGKLINGGVWLDNPTNVPRCNMDLELQDFTGAMELNPQQLGANAPLLLEKIRLHSLTE